MNKSGFTLIELLVASAIAAMVSITLFTALFQVNKSVVATEDVMDTATQLTRLQQILERDLSGATTLLDNEPLDLAKTPTPAPSAMPGTPSTKQPPASQPKKEKKIITKIFSSTNRGALLDMLTFISNNPLLGYWTSGKTGGDVGKVKPLLARVTYKLEDDKTNPGTYRLTRQESVPLDFEKRSGRTYEIANNIRSLKIKFTAKIVKTFPVKEEKAPSQGQQPPPPGQAKPGGQPASAQQPEKPKIEVTYKEMDSWTIEEKTMPAKVPNKNEPEEKQKPIPVIVKVSVVFVNAQQKESDEYVFEIPIITDTEY